MSSESYEKNEKVLKILEAFGNIFFLNVLFIVFSIPIITIGASVTALYSMMLKMIENKEKAIWKGFVSAFKENFKKATLIWLILLGVSVLIGVEVIFVIQYGGPVATFYTILVALEIAVVLLCLPFLFPLVARYDNTIPNTIKNAFLLSLSNLWSAIKIILGWGMPIFLSAYYPETFVYTWWAWLLLVFGIIAYCTSFTLRKVFRKIEAVQEENNRKKAEAEAKAAEEQARKKAMNKNYHRSHREIMKEMAKQNQGAKDEESEVSAGETGSE